MFLKPLQPVSLLLALLLGVAAVGLGSRAQWATLLWPWPDGRLTYWFVASIIASMAIAIAWIGAFGHWYAALPGTVNVFVSAGAMAVFLTGALPSGDGTPTAAPTHSAALGAFALVNLALFFVFLRAPAPSTPRMPKVVFASFVVFALVLLAVGAALVLGVPNVMPWPMQPRSAILVGWIFLGDALYFLLPLWRPVWTNACAPLLSFLAYDLVLLPPLFAHVSAVRPEHQASLYVYIAVLVYSAVLAIWFLFVNAATRRALLTPWRDEA